MPWRLIVKAFGWRTATDEDGATPILVVCIPGLDGILPVPRPGSAPYVSLSTRRNLARPTPTERRFDAYLVAVNLLVQANHCPESAIADALNGILTPDMRKHAGNNSALIDWAIAGDDIASSIAGVSLPDNYVPDVSALPLWPTGTVR